MSRKKCSGIFLIGGYFHLLKFLVMEEETLEVDGKREKFSVHNCTSTNRDTLAHHLVVKLTCLQGKSICTKLIHCQGVFLLVVIGTAGWYVAFCQ